jgi:hypothetical protein
MDITTVIIVALIAIAFNFSFGGFIVSALVEWLLALGFEKTEGRVVLSEVSRHNRSTQANIHYTYQVNGKTFTGSKVHPGMIVGGQAAYRIQKRYPVGKTVTVYYARKFPAWSLLEVTLLHIVDLVIFLIIGDLAALWFIFPDQFMNVVRQLQAWLVSLF